MGNVSAQLGEQASTLWEAYDAWLRRATSVIGESADALNAMNVFPVPDVDTGSNLKLTMTGIAHTIPSLERASLDAAVQAAILWAHGNSGAIVAEMFVSVCRALQYDVQGLQSMPPGTLVATLLRLAAVAARRAVARPVAGTILTVADDAASAAEAVAGDGVLRIQRDRALERGLLLEQIFDEAGEPVALESRQRRRHGGVDDLSRDAGRDLEREHDQQ